MITDKKINRELTKIGTYFQILMTILGLVFEIPLKFILIPIFLILVGVIFFSMMDLISKVGEELENPRPVKYIMLFIIEVASFLTYVNFAAL